MLRQHRLPIEYLDWKNDNADSHSQCRTPYLTHKPTIGLTDIHQILNLVHFSLTCDICGNSINDPPDN